MKIPDWRTLVRTGALLATMGAVVAGPQPAADARAPEGSSSREQVRVLGRGESMQMRSGVVVMWPRQDRELGSGCPGDRSTLVSAAADGTSIAVSYAQLSVAAGPGEGSRYAAVRCSLSLPIEVPAGLSLRLTDVTYRGTSLGLEDPRARAHQDSVLRLSDPGASTTSTRHHRIVPEGPAGDWQFTNRLSRFTVSADCGGGAAVVQLVSTLRLRAVGVDAFVAQDTADVASVVLHLETRRCSP